MSFCRFSSECFSSDVYCYEDVSGGITIMVAGNKLISDTPRTVRGDSDDTDDFMEYHRRCEEWTDSAERVAIGLSRDSEDFNVDTFDEAKDLLLSLREEGYTVPQYAIDALTEEAEACKTATDV